MPERDVQVRVDLAAVLPQPALRSERVRLGKPALGPQLHPLVQVHVHLPGGRGVMDGEMLQGVREHDRVWMALKNISGAVVDREDTY